MAIKNYFIVNKKSMVYSMIENCFQTASPQEKGTKLDHLIALSFLLEPQEKDPISCLTENKIIQLPKWWKERTYNPFEIKKIVKSQILTKFSEEKWNPEEWIIPDTKSGPDMAILGEIIIFNGNKFSTTQCSVKTDDVINNFKKTNFQNFYSEKTEDPDKLARIKIKQDNIEKKKDEKEVKGIIRMHVILPKAAKPKASPIVGHFSPGIRIFKSEGSIIEEIIVEIDKSNLKDSHIFSKENSGLILKYLK